MPLKWVLVSEHYRKIMKVVYTAPNRAHHYKYANALNAAGYLHAFVSGFPRLNPLAKARELDGKIHHADLLQTLYIASLKFKLPVDVNNWLALWSKIEQDRACRKFVEGCDIFLFYNGSGLSSSRYGKKKGVINIVEAVNTHVEYQEEILEEEHKNLNLAWKPFPKNEKKRRLKEYEIADYILLPSEFVKRSFMIKGFPEKKLLKVPYGFDNRIFQRGKNNQENSNDRFTVLYVGSISVRKGIRYLIQAFKDLNHPNKQLLLVGPNTDDGSLKDITLTDDIALTGALKGKQLEDVYQSADVFCLPSIEDGFGLVLGEALSVGLPIIATVNTGAEEMITNEKEGFIVPIRNSQIICEKLQLLADNATFHKSLCIAATEKSSKLKGWDEAGLRLVSTLKSVLTENYNNK